MGKKKGKISKRRFFSLCFDTLGAFILFIVLLFGVWMSMRDLPITTATKVARDLKKQTKEERISASKRFIVKYAPGVSLTPANDPSTIAFGDDGSKIKGDVLRYEFDSGFHFTSPREKLPSFEIEEDSSNSSIDFTSVLEKPTVRLGKIENRLLSRDNAQITTKQKAAIAKDVSHINWELPSSVPMSSMPNLEGLLRKYGWLTGNLDIMFTVGDDGFVSNVIIYSLDVVDAELLLELKRKLLALHLGKRNANKALTIRLYWNLP